MTKGISNGMKYFVFGLLGIAILGGVWLFGRSSESQSPVGNQEGLLQFSEAGLQPIASINGFKLQLEVAKTLEDRASGLSGQESLALDTGMLFVFEEATIPGFWMKEMNFPIDIIWIDTNKRVVDITENVAPETFPQTFYPHSPIQYVLEVNAYWAKDHNISVGGEVTFHGVF